MDSARPRWLGPAIATAVSVALAGDRAWLGWRARHALVSHLLSAPPLWLWIPALAIALAALPIALHLARSRGDVRFARMPLLLTVVLLFLEVFVMPTVEPAGGALASRILVRGIAALVETRLPDDGRIPQTAEELSAALDQLAPPPYLIHGVRQPAWQLRIESHCKGPELETDGAGAGTLFYCLAEDGQRAWITAVGLASATFGTPELLRVGAAPAVGMVEVARSTAPQQK